MAEISMIGANVRIVDDTSTNERGLQLKVINRTGATSVKGTIVTPSASYDNAAELVTTTSPYDATGVVYEAGVADGSPMWIWTTGAICKVLMEDSEATTRGDWMRCSTVTNGRGKSDAIPTPPTSDTHFQEIGHAMESNAGGTDQLVLTWFHTL
jgi:hypothetical protein